MSIRTEARIVRRRRALDRMAALVEAARPCRVEAVGLGGLHGQRPALLGRDRSEA